MEFLPYEGTKKTDYLSFSDEATLPNTLEEALHELEKDSVMTEALGSQFIDWYAFLIECG